MTTRLLTLLSLLLFMLTAASRAGAQAIDSALRYFPLAVGNVWQYDREKGTSSPLPGAVQRSHFTVEVLADTLLSDGRRYFEISAGRSLIMPYFPRYIRIDSASGAMYQFGNAEPFNWLRCDSSWHQSNIGIGCGENMEDLSVFGMHVPTKWQPNFETRAAWAYEFGYVEGWWSMMIDPITYQFIRESLIYAKIDGREYGERLKVGSTWLADAALELGVTPNPCRTQALIRVLLPSSGPVRLTVNDALGTTMTTVAEQPMSAGEHMLRLDLSGQPNGMYYCVLQAGDRRIVQPILVLR